MCDEGASKPPYNASRAARLQMLAQQYQLDAIILITGFDGSYNLESKGLVEWLCDCAAAAETDFKAAALEEGLFLAMPSQMAWFVDQDSDDMADDAVCALDRLLADPAAAPAGSSDVDMMSQATPPTSPPAAHAEPAAAAGGAGLATQQQQQQQQTLIQNTQVDGKLSLLLQLHPQLRRVGIALGVEVRGGVQQQVGLDNIFRWPLLMAFAEQLQVPMEQLFQEVVDITPSLRTLFGYVDGTHLSNTLRLRRPLLTRAWLETMGVCGRRSTTPKLDLTEAAIAAPVTEFVSGCGCRLKPGQYQPLAVPPRVLFGTRTAHHEALSSSTLSLRSQAAKQGSAVLHATLEAADACSPLRVARTIFFSQGAGTADTPLQLRLQAQQQLQQGVQLGSCSGSGSRSGQMPAAAGAVDDDAAAVCRCNSGAANNNAGSSPARQQAQQQQQQKAQQPQQQLQELPVGQSLAGGDYEVDHVDLFDLMCWYWAAVDAAWQCMEYYATQDGATWASAQSMATRVFWDAAAAAQLVSQHSSTQELPQQRPQLQLQLFSWDGGPRPMPSGADLQQHNHKFKTLRVTVSDIRSRSPAHPGLLLGSVLYMDSFADVPALGESPARLINLTLTHCPTYSFDYWGTEAATNTQRVAAFRRHLQLQLQSQLQAESQAQAAAMRKSADDSAVLRMQLQQSIKGGGGRGAQRRASLGQQQQQQLLLLQQLAAAGNGRGGGSTTAQQRQQHLLQHLQQQQQQGGRGSGGSSSSNGGRAEQAARGGKHALVSSSSCCGEPEVAVAQYNDSSNGLQALKRSCCGTSQPQGAAAAAAAAGAASAAVPTPVGPLDLANAAEVPAGAAGATAAGGEAGSEVENAVVSSDGGAAGPAAAAARDAAFLQWRQLGWLLAPPGEMPGEVALVLTGAMKLAVMDGPMYAFSNGLVFVSRPTKVHVLLLEQLEAVWLQDFAGQIPGYPDLGPCIVMKGTQPCCGLLPAVHMTDNHHIVVPLRAMTKACSQHWVTVVLPAWQAAAAVVKASKGASAPWPLPAQFQPFYTYWLQGPRKRYMLPQPDEWIDQLVQQLDRPPQH